MLNQTGEFCVKFTLPDHHIDTSLESAETDRLVAMYKNDSQTWTTEIPAGSRAGTPRIEDPAPQTLKFKYLFLIIQCRFLV